MVWGRQAGRIEGSVVATLPGHGKDTRTPLASAAAMADALVEDLGTLPGPAVLIGHSLGVAVALEIAAGTDFPVEGLVLIAGGARLAVPEEVRERVRDDFAGEAQRLAKALWFSADETTIERSLRTIHDAGPDALARDYEACAAFDARGWLDRIEVPALVISGAEDFLTPPSLSEELADGLPDAQHVTVPGGAHMVMAERDDEVNLLVAGFLARREIALTDS